MLSHRIIDIVHRFAKQQDVPVMVALAICEVESGGDSMAIRYEPGWKYQYNMEHFAKLCNTTVETERVLQACSFGLMQVMGTVARELGHTGSLVQLLDPFVGAKYGCMKLAKLFETHKSSLDDVIASYNAGSPIKRPSGEYVNQYYVDKVKSILKPELV
jgi:hypothetical protein